MDTQLDPSIMNLTKAIGQTESGGSYTVQGKSGEYGAYQYTEPTWNTDSQKYLGQAVPLKQATPAQQDEVAYKKVEDLGKQGYQPDQIASIWNSGKPDYAGNVGTNSHGVHFDTPAYVKSVGSAYDQLSQGNDNPTITPNPSSVGIPAPSDNNSQQPDTSIGSQLGARVNDANQAIQTASQGASDIVNGNIAQGAGAIASGALQTVGAVAGGLGDVVNKAFEQIPYVKSIENVIGSSLSDYAKTPGGQAVVASLQKFQQDNPTLSKNAGAVFNIATAIPVLRGLSSIVSVGLDAASQVLKPIAEKSFTGTLNEVISSTGKTGRQFLSDNPNITRELVQERAIPDIKDGRYEISDAVAHSNNKIVTLNDQVEEHLNQPQFAGVAENPQPILNNVLTGYVDRNGNKVRGFPNSNFSSQDIVANGRELTPQNGRLWDKFEAGQANVAEINTLRSDLDASVKNVYTSVNQPPIKSSMGAALAGSMRDFVQSTVPETQGLFSSMSKQFNIQKGLEFINGKKVTLGTAGTIGRGIATGAGEAAGGAMGLPFAGAAAGYMSSNLMSKVAPKEIVRGILNRTGKDAVRQSVGQTVGKSAKGLLYNLANEQRQKIVSTQSN